VDNEGRPDPDAFKAVQIGGPSGACLSAEHLDLHLDFDSLKKIGAMVGSGGLVVMNKSTCMVRIAAFFMKFTQNESCGKCVLCREGTKQLLALLTDITEGRGTEETLKLMTTLSQAIQKGSLCALGKGAPNPVVSTLKSFRTEYEAHVFHKYCPTHECKALSKPSIDPALCKGCGLCKRKCPVSAIEGTVKVAPRILEDVCIACGACAAACKFNAVIGA
jgi:NADH-quinone oxidoreductase subunit F